MTRRRQATMPERAQAIAYLRAGGRPEAVPAHVRAEAWRAAGRNLYRNAGAGWLAVHSLGAGQVAIETVAGVPTMAREDGRVTPYPLHPVKRYDGPVDGVPAHSLPCGGRASVFVTTDGAVHRGLYWTGNYASMADDTGDRIAGRMARAQATDTGAQAPGR